MTHHADVINARIAEVTGYRFEGNVLRSASGKKFEFESQEKYEQVSGQPVPLLLHVSRVTNSVSVG